MPNRHPKKRPKRKAGGSSGSDWMDALFVLDIITKIADICAAVATIILACVALKAKGPVINYIKLRADEIKARKGP